MDSSNIQRRLVPDDQRTAITDQLFGMHFPIRIEPLIFHATSTIAPAYTGGFWQFYTMTIPGDNAPGFYMAPNSEERYEVRCQGNFFEGVMSADALGLVACMTAYSHLSFSRDDGFGIAMAGHFHRLRAFAVEHPEATAIIGAID